MHHHELLEFAVVSASEQTVALLLDERETEHKKQMKQKIHIQGNISNKTNGNKVTKSAGLLQFALAFQKNVFEKRDIKIDCDTWAAVFWF